MVVPFTLVMVNGSRSQSPLVVVRDMCPLLKLTVILPCHLVVLSALVVVLSVVVIFEHWELGLLLPFKYELVGCLLCDCMRGVSVTVPSFLPIWANFFLYGAPPSL